MEHNEPAEGDTDDEDGNDYDDESIELESDLEAQLMKGSMRFHKQAAKQAGKKKRKSDDEMEEVDEEESTRGKKKARK